jgi:hypothetical protein
MRALQGRRSTLPLTALCAIVALLCAGCPNANTYGTPRTVPKGEIQHSIAVEGIGYAAPGSAGFLPTLPTYTFRVGVHDRIDIGARVSNLTSLGLDGKFNIVRGFFDLALDPGVQGFYIASSAGGAGIFYIHAPILLGINPTDWFSITLTPGIVGAIATATLTTDSTSRNQVTTASGVLGRAGIGFEFRIGNSFAIHPEFTVMGNFKNEGFIFNGGIGFNFGKLPRYDDLKDPEPPSAGPPAMPPPVAVPPAPASP